jgi:hypothetical protein
VQLAALVDLCQGIEVLSTEHCLDIMF